MVTSRNAGQASGRSVTRSILVGLPPDQVWELVTDRRCQGLWIGPGAVFPPVKGSRIQLADEVGPWRGGTVSQVRHGKSKSLRGRIARASSWPAAQGDTELTIRVEPQDDGGSKVTAVEVGFASDPDGTDPVADCDHFWSNALGRLQDVVCQVTRRRRRPRQAVVIIHGIGEQEPGATLEEFVGGGVLLSEEPESWVKPDYASRLLELRRVTLKGTASRPTTDVFELYWAHIIRDTTLSQIVAWVRQLLFRWGVPRPLLVPWLALWLVLVLLLFGLVTRFLGIWEWTRYVAGGSLLAVTATLVWRAAGRGFLVNSIGDAARYLTPRPGNIAHRQTIREAGIDLLDTLHRNGQFDRIVILGHSLGSVIAYDIVTHYWVRVHRHHFRPRAPGFLSLRKMERAIDPLDVKVDIDEVQRLQHEAWKEQRRNTQPWLVTDLVTVGSPLTYGDFLMARNRGRFKRAKETRVLPTCPPQTQVEDKSRHKRCSFEVPYVGRRGTGVRTFTVLDHAAPFAVTRWTNLYFPQRIPGDPIGGPVVPMFGSWIRDVPLAMPKHGFFAHTNYWRGTGQDDAHLQKLAEALQLDSRQGLTDEMKRMDPRMHVGHMWPAADG